MEGPDPQGLVKLHEAAVVTLKKWQEARKGFIELQKAADVAVRLTAEAAIESTDAWRAYDKAEQALEAEHQRWRVPTSPTPADTETSSEDVLKLLRGQ